MSPVVKAQQASRLAPLKKIDCATCGYHPPPFQRTPAALSALAVLHPLPREPSRCQLSLFFAPSLTNSDHAVDPHPAGTARLWIISGFATSTARLTSRKSRREFSCCTRSWVRCRVSSCLVVAGKRCARCALFTFPPRQTRRYRTHCAPHPLPPVQRMQNCRWFTKLRREVKSSFCCSAFAHGYLVCPPRRWYQFLSHGRVKDPNAPIPCHPIRV